MKQTFECVEKHLYRRQYQTAGGDWSTLYYVIFLLMEKETPDVSGWIGSQDRSGGMQGS